MHNKLVATLLFFFLVVIGCSNQKEHVTLGADIQLEQLREQMIGTFSSAEQASLDSTYYDITLNMHPIWEDSDKEGFFLYVEQSVSSMLDSPYRQRVYHVYRVGENKFLSEIYSLAQPSKWIGVFNSRELWSELTFDSLLVRKGCGVYLEEIENSMFAGSTDENSCESTMRGASYATSRVEIARDLIYSWDRGFDSTGTQVWGAEVAGYLFKRIKN